MSKEPHLILEFSNMSVCKDVYRLLCHAVEHRYPFKQFNLREITIHSTSHSALGSADKERIAMLWRDFLRYAFSKFQYVKAFTKECAGYFTAFQHTACTQAPCMPCFKRGPNSQSLFTPGQQGRRCILTSVSCGTNLAPRFCEQNQHSQVLTLFGSGTVLGFRAVDKMYEVQLPYGKAVLNPGGAL
jgi:hypothetical protein